MRFPYALEEAVSAALAAPVVEAERYVQRQPVRDADETSWREKGKRRWLWISVTPLVTILRLLKTRGAAGAKELVGEGGGIIGTDHSAGYHWLDPRHRQLCWTHLKREFEAWSERAGETARSGLALLAAEKQLFTLWYRVRDGTLAWAAFPVAMLPLMARVQILLQEEGGRRGHENARPVSQSAQTGSGLVDVCVGAGSRADKQRG